MKYRIEITENGVNFRFEKTRTLTDEDGNPVTISDGFERVAVGKGDFVEDIENMNEEETAAYRARLDEVMLQYTGKSWGDL